jgi:hygromycin-B 7''-O-kinase
LSSYFKVVEKKPLMGTRDPLFDRLENIEGYRQAFTDGRAWRPYVRQVCQRHGLLPARKIRCGVPGSFPTFIVDERWVVKFFGRLFEGALDYQVELEASRLLSPYALPVPAILAEGNLFESLNGWNWPYLVFEFVPGVSIGKVYEQVSFDDKLQLAGWMGELTRRLHQVPLVGSTIFQPAWDEFFDLLRTQRAAYQAVFQAGHTGHAGPPMPPHLVDQIDRFLLPAELLVEDSAAPHLIHADLTADHILGLLQNGQWHSAALIDFGDAMTGSLYYELVALHLDLFRCDKRLLRAYLDAYGLDEASRRQLPAKAMTLTLLHRFNTYCMEGVFRRDPQTLKLATLEEMADRIWDINTPGLEE